MKRLLSLALLALSPLSAQAHDYGCKITVNGNEYTLTLSVLGADTLRVTSHSGTVEFALSRHTQRFDVFSRTDGEEKAWLSPGMTDGAKPLVQGTLRFDAGNAEGGRAFHDYACTINTNN